MSATKSTRRCGRLRRSKTPLEVQRGSLVCLSRVLSGASALAIVVSNDVQNEASPYVLVVPVQRRRARLRAPFAVDLGRGEGFRDLHTARCDWATRVAKREIKALERASLPQRVIEKIDQALMAALGLAPHRAGI